MNPVARLWRNLSLVARLAVSAGFVVAVAGVATLYSSVVSESAWHQHNLAVQAKSELSMLVPVLADAAVVGDYAAMERMLAIRVHRDNIDGIRFLDSTGTIVRADRERVGVSVAPRWFRRLTRLSGEEQTGELDVGGRHYGSVSIQMSPVPAQDRVWTSFVSHGLILLLAVCVQFGGIFLILRSGLKPLDALVAGARRLGGGDLAVRLVPNGSPELREVTGAFNQMADDVGRLVATGEAQRQTLARREAWLSEFIAIVSLQAPRAERVCALLAMGCRHLSMERGELRLDDGQGAWESVDWPPGATDEPPAQACGGEAPVQVAGQRCGVVRFFGRDAVPDGDQVSLVTLIADWIGLAVAYERKERALAQEKERAQVTLCSIGDAVISCDAAGRIEFLNPVAEELTGWRAADATGRALPEVFRIVSENTRETLDNPVDIVLRRGAVVGLANHTLLIRRDGLEMAIEDSAAPIRDPMGNILGVVLVFHDVTQAREMSQQMSWQAAHDSLTGLPNRAEFERRAKALIQSAIAGARHALLYLDLDQFKIVNDTCGHAAGDELLRQLSVVLNGHLRMSDLLARIGGDEFGVLLENCPLEQATQIAHELLDATRSFRYAWDGRSFVVGVSIGAVAVTGQESLADLMSAADTACYAAKDLGRNQVQVYRADNRDINLRHGEMHWVARINHAFEDERFMLYGQPIVPVAPVDQPSPPHMEILLRLVDERGQLVSPSAFIPAAERYGVIGAVDRWVVRNTLNWLAEREGGAITCAINLSGHSLGDGRFLDFVMQQISGSGARPQDVCFEITETAAIANLSKAVHFIGELKAIGCSFALDDFGSGLSSFGYLKNLPVDFVKIDGGFVKDVHQNAVNRAMVAAINDITHGMGLKTVAEFVENAEIFSVLGELGVDLAQGFGIARPARIDGASWAGVAV